MIVRELFIRLGFVKDKASVEEANETVRSFKTRSIVAASAVTFAFAKMFQYLNNISRATLDADQLSRSLGVTVNELNGIIEALKQFNLSDSDAVSVLTQVNKLTRDFKNGLGDLPKIARRLRFEPDRDGNAEKTLNQILLALSKIENEQTRINEAARIFGDSLAAGVADASRDLDNFSRVSSEFSKLTVEELDAQKNAAKEYRQSLNDLNQALLRLSQSVVQHIVPVFTKFVDLITEMVGFYRTLFTGKFDESLDFAKKIGEIVDPVTRPVVDLLSGIKSSALGLFDSGVNAFDRFKNYAISDASMRPAPGVAFGGYFSGGSSGANITVNNEISVPPGTSQETAEYISTEIERNMNRAFRDGFIEIQNDNPQVE